MDKSSESLSPEAKARSWRASNCSCADYDSLDSCELCNLIVGPYEAYVTSKSYPVRYIHGSVPIDPIHFYKPIYITNESQTDITAELQGSQKPHTNDQNCKNLENNVVFVDTLKKNFPENENHKKVRLETSTNLYNDETDKIEIQNLKETSKKIEEDCKERKNKTKINATMLSHNLEEISPAERSQNKCQEKSCSDFKSGKDKKETTDNSLKQIYSASVTQHGNTINMDKELIKDAYPEIEGKVICFHKDCTDTEDLNAKDNNHGAFNKTKNKDLNASGAIENINQVTPASKLQNTRPSKVTNKTQEMLTKELSKEINMYHSDSLIHMNKCLGEKTTQHKDLHNQEKVCLENYRNNEFDKKHCNSTCLNVYPLNKVISDAKIDDKIEVCKPSDNKSLKNLPEEIIHDRTNVTPEHNKKPKIICNSKLMSDEIKKDALYHAYACLKPGHNHKITNDTKALRNTSIKGELDFINASSRCGLNKEITNLSKPPLKENMKCGFGVCPKHSKKSEIKNRSKLLLKEKNEGGSYPTCPKHSKNPDVTKLNMSRTDGQICPKHQLALNSCFADQHKYNNTPVKKYKKFCPAYCPLCHKLYIEEQNDELEKKTRVPFKECRKCRKNMHKIIPKEEKQKNKQPEDNICTEKNIIQTPYKANDQQEKEKVNPTADQNGLQITKTKICSAECFVPKDQTYISKTKEIRHDSITCKSLYETQNSITDRQESKNILLGSQNNIDMMTYIKDCIREELEEIRRSLRGNKINDNNNLGYTWKKIQPSTHDKPADHNDSPALYDNSQEIKTDAKNINLRCHEDKKLQNINYDKPSEQACQENSTAFLGKFKNFIYKDILGTFSGQNENIIHEIDSKTETHDEPTTTHKVSSIIKTDKKHTISNRTMHTNVCEIVSGNKTRQQKRTLPSNLIIKGKYDQSSAFVGNVKPTSKSYATSADELTAQIMNVPYKLFKKITRLETKPVHSIGLLQKVKEVYAACSCKMCECISTTTGITTSETCNCKPCDCPECHAMDVYSCSKHNYWMKDTNNKYQQKKTHLNSSQCQCKPYDCIKCKKDSLRNPCDCTPCECTECKSMGLYKQTNYIVASVRDNQERPYCSCSPCGCFDCAHPLGTAAPTHYSQETETDNHRHINCNCDNCVNENCEQEGLDTCTCERHAKLMSKPVTTDKKEFDIHYFLHKATNVKSFLHPRDMNGNAISIYTSLTHQIYCPGQTKPRVYNNLNSADYSKYASTVSSRIASMLPQDYWALRSNTTVMLNSSRDCSCKPCDCQKCKRHFLEGHIPYRRSSWCEVCQCINCATLSVSYDIERKYSKKLNDPLRSQICNCKPCECYDCTKYMISSVHDRSRLYDKTCLRGNTKSLVKDNIRSNRFLKLLRASDSEHYIDLILSDRETKNRSLDSDDYNSLRTQTGLNVSEDMKSYDKDVQNNKVYLYTKQEQNRTPRFDYIPDKKYRTDELEDDNIIYHDRKSGYNNDKRDSTEIYLSDRIAKLNSTVLTGAASLEQKFYVSRFGKQPMTQESSPDSSYNSNSIDHESSDYSLHEPTSTVETCINDVMDLRQYHKTNNYFKPNVVSKSNKAYLETSTNVLKTNNKFPFFGLNVINDNGQVQIVDNNNRIYDNFTVDKACQCKLCDCGDCSYKLPKLNSFKFDSTACGCDGILIRQNESTQTAKLTLKSEEDMSTHFPSLMKKWNVSFSDNDRIIKWTDVPTQNYLNNTMSSTARTERPAINYDSVRRTIKEAKQFSLELLNILQKYEKANKDFDKLAIKFKEIHEPLTRQIEELKKLDRSTSIDIFSYDQSVSTIESKLYSDNPSDITNTDHQEIDSHYNLITNVQTINEQEIEEYATELKEKIEENLNEINAEPSTEIGHDIIKQENDKINKIDVNISAKINKTPIQNSEETAHLEKLKMEFTEYSVHLDKVLDKCRKNIWSVKKSSIATLLSKPQLDKTSTSRDQKTEIPQNSELLLKGPSSIEKSIDKDSSDLNTVFICHSHKDHDNHKELKSNILIHQQMDSFTVSTNMDAHATRSFKATQMSRTSREIQSQARSCRIFESAPSMGSKRLLDWVAKSTANTSITSHLTHNSSHNPLKVIFQTVRVLSDHSILLKWKIPEDTSSIEGYEILVDGRSVQKILSPTKNIAALSCLPHADKLKLTVRTLTKPPAGPLPSATIVVSTRP